LRVIEEYISGFTALIQKPDGNRINYSLVWGFFVSGWKGIARWLAAQERAQFAVIMRIQEGIGQGIFLRS
jgi:hypothetical protein